MAVAAIVFTPSVTRKKEVSWVSFLEMPLPDRQPSARNLFHPIIKLLGTSTTQDDMEGSRFPGLPGQEPGCVLSKYLVCLSCRIFSHQPMAFLPATPLPHFKQRSQLKVLSAGGCEKHWALSA